ncbi:hypothetical protein C8R45DRAFT_1044252, partial [Mycena sanguinolenta]
MSHHKEETASSFLSFLYFAYFLAARHAAQQYVVLYSDPHFKSRSPIATSLGAARLNCSPYIFVPHHDNAILLWM